MTPAATHQKRPAATHCPRGHSEWRYKQTGRRVCKECERRADAERRRRRAAATAELVAAPPTPTLGTDDDGKRYPIDEWKRLFGAPAAGMIGSVRYATEPEWCE